MDNTQSRNETLVFGLDIGTRSIVGVVGYMERNRFKVILAMAEQKHKLEQCLMVRFMISIKLAIQSEKLRILLRIS